jgi:hypothetical protein
MARKKDKVWKETKRKDSTNSLKELKRMQQKLVWRKPPKAPNHE